MTKPARLMHVIVDSTVQSKANAQSVNNQVLEAAHRKEMGADQRAGIALKQTFAKLSKTCGVWRACQTVQEGEGGNSTGLCKLAGFKRPPPKDVQHGRAMES